MSEPIDHIYPFTVAENDVVHINTRADKRGAIELQAIEGAAVYCFRGTLSKDEAKLAAADNFLLAAAIGQSAICKSADELGAVTVFSKKAATGFVRVIEGC